MSDTPIADHALLSDCASAALVDRAGSVEWWCVPRFDSPSVFARILDDGAGHFALRPVDVVAVERRYADRSLVLVTTFRTPTGSVELHDALAMAEGARVHDLGRDSPHVLLRRLVCTEGAVDVTVSFVPRFEYGLTAPVLSPLDGGLLARGGPVALVLSAPAGFDVDGAAAHGHVNLTEGQSASFSVEYASSWTPPPDPWPADRIDDRLADTLEAWRSWSDTVQRYEGPYEDEVRASGRVLHALTYQATGGIIAAPTTSLPEAVGGNRNWDYRYVWVRDASLTLDALWVAACPDDAGAFLRYLTTVASNFHETNELQIMFGVLGDRDLTEREIPWLDGWCRTAPVRVGNGAWHQTQLDVYGELLAAVHRLRDQIGEFDDLQRRFLVRLADAAAARWEEPDQGIWEVRGPPAHYVHSKLMCWVALDRALALAQDIGAGARTDRWEHERARVRAAILEQGWNDDVGAFTQCFGDDALDASNLLIGTTGLLPPDDPRVLATIEATEAHLTDARGLVYRYRSDDGLEGDEGTFLLCTFWLAEALARAGRVERAREVFERAAATANDLGLLAEQVDASTGAMLGNFPQAFSHIGLVHAAWAIATCVGR